jgi:hypothetical protein
LDYTHIIIIYLSTSLELGDREVRDVCTYAGILRPVSKENGPGLALPMIHGPLEHPAETDPCAGGFPSSLGFARDGPALES